MYKLKNIIVVLVIIFGSCFGTSLVNAYEGNLEDVTVRGTVSKEIAPDMALVNFYVTGTGRTADAATSNTAKSFDRIKSSLLGLAITGDDIKSRSYNLYPEYDKDGDITGYTAKSFLKITVDDLNKLGNVIDKLAAAGVHGINGIDFSVKNKELMQKQLLTEAVQNARIQADILAAADGRRAGRILSIRSVNYSDAGRAYNYAERLMKADSTPTVINPDMIAVSASVEAVFTLE